MTPHFVAATITLALAIAAAGAIGGAAHSLLFQPTGISRSGDLVVAWETNRAHSQAVVEVSYRNFENWRSSSQTLSQVAAIGSSAWPTVMEGHGDPAKLATIAVSGSFFDTLGVRPHLGRLIQQTDDIPGQPRRAVLSHALWRSRFGNDPAIVGKTIEGDGLPILVVGVAAPDFNFPRGTDLWMPVAPLLTEGVDKAANLSRIGVLFLIGRLAAGTTPSLAERELDELARRFQESGTYRFGTGVRVTPLLDYMYGPVRTGFRWMLGAVLVLLIITCANLSALSLSHALRSKRQQAIRLALGASGFALRRPLLVETAGIASSAAILGMVAARGVLATVTRLAPDDLPRLGALSMSPPLALLMVALSVMCALMSRAWPLGGDGRALVSDLQDTSHATASRRSMNARALLLRAQIALTVALLAATGLIVRSYMQLRQLDLGFDPANVLTLNIEPQQRAVNHNAWTEDLLTQIRTIDGVEHAGAVLVPPLALGAIGSDTLVILEGQPVNAAAPETNPDLNYQAATMGYFRAMNVALVRGRLFTADDRESSERVVLVSESTARRLWPGENPVGKRLVLPSMDLDPSPVTPQPIWRTVVGVVSDVRYRGLDDVRLDVYEPASQSRSQVGYVVVKTTRNPAAVAAIVQAQARQMDARVVISGVTTLEVVVARALAAWRLSAWMLSAFAVMALVLAVSGLFGAAAIDSTQRAREFALRMAFGAERRDIVRRVLTAAAHHTVPGVLIGTACAAAGSRWMSSFLFQTNPLDMTTYALVGVVMMAVTGLAGAVPAVRAGRTDPATLLRE